METSNVESVQEYLASEWEMQLTIDELSAMEYDFSRRQSTCIYIFVYVQLFAAHGAISYVVFIVVYHAAHSVISIAFLGVVREIVVSMCTW